MIKKINFLETPQRTKKLSNIQLQILYFDYQQA